MPYSAAAVDSQANTVRLSLADLETPCLVLDLVKMERNIVRLRERTQSLGVPLRPHLKTVKSVDIARQVMTTPQGPATVSTLKEARQFADAGVTDLLYAVGIAPAKLPAIVDLWSEGTRVIVILDTEVQAQAVVVASRAAGIPLAAMIEVDCDGHRSGVDPTDSELLVRIGRILVEGGAALHGVLTHAGESYNARDPAALRRAAEGERTAVVGAARILREAGLPCPVVSVGSTPTAHFATVLTGVTEVRAGVYIFFDLVMAGIGVCQVDDIALSVLATVIGHQKAKGWTIVDAGWMAMSRDRGTTKQSVDQGYGKVCDLAGTPYADLVMIDANQEHGIIGLRRGTAGAAPEFQIGDRLRILPNHACATGAQHACYHAVRGPAIQVEVVYPRFSGW